jgi:hypothetical protein
VTGMVAIVLWHVQLTFESTSRWLHFPAIPVTQPAPFIFEAWVRTPWRPLLTPKCTVHCKNARRTQCTIDGVAQCNSVALCMVVAAR